MRDANRLAQDYIALWNETDQKRRLALLADTWTTDASYVDPLMRGSGHREIDGLIAAVQEMTTRLGVNLWVVEKNAFQAFLTQLDQFRLWLYSRGVRLREHQTHGNKWDADFGVAAMAGLFLSCGRPREDNHYEWERTPDSALIELPSPRISRATGMLVEQLAVWSPTTMRERQLTDLVMALWFMDIGAREYLGPGRQRTNFLSPMGATRDDVAGRKVINLNELAERRLAGEATG